MKVNRFGCSQKTFITMAVLWLSEQERKVTSLISRDDLGDAQRHLEDAEQFMQRVFLADDDRIIQDLRVRFIALRNKMATQLQALTAPA